MTEEKNVTFTEDDPEGLGLVVPEKVDKYFKRPLEGSLDVKAVLHADPRKLDDFMETLEYVGNWVLYTAFDNKANLITFTKKAIENAKIDGNDDKYALLSTLINSMQVMIDIIKPIVDGYEKEVREENHRQMERRARQDEEAERIRLAEKERVRRESLEKSRKFSQDMRESEEKRKQAALKQQDEDEW